MVNSITVSWEVWADGERRYQEFLKNNKKEPPFIAIQGNNVELKDWKDSQNRVNNFRKDNNNQNPPTVRLTIPSTLVIEPPKNDIIPTFHFNQQNVGKGYAEFCCGPVSALICASAYDLANRDNFMSKSYGLIDAMKTTIGSGTTPDNMVNGFNKYFTTLIMERQDFTEKNIRDNVENQIPMVFNILTNSDFGYKGQFGHYVAATGYNGKVGISDPHGFNIGRGQRWWYNYSTVKKAVDNNGSRPIFRVRKK